MTAELKKGKYVYYRCTGFKGRCGNTLHPPGSARGPPGRRRSTPSRFPPRSPTASQQALQTSQSDADQDRRETRERLDKQRRRAGLEAGSRLRRLRGGPDFRGLLDAEVGAVGGRSGGRSKPKSPASSRPSAHAGAHGPEDFRTRETGRFSVPNAGSGRTASVARNGAIELHVRSRKSLSYLQ